jgi:hypothetical protein
MQIDQGNENVKYTSVKGVRRELQSSRVFAEANAPAVICATRADSAMLKSDTFRDACGFRREETIHD